MEYRHIHEPRVLDCLIIHPRLREQAKSLAEKFNMKSELMGPPVPIDDVRQLKHALKAKSHQLPPDKPGIIVIFTNLVFFGSTEEFYKEVVYQVEDEVYDIPNLVACSVVNQMSMLSSKTIFEDQPNYTLFRKSVDGLTGETILTIKNKYSPYKDMAISKKIIDVLSKS